MPGMGNLRPIENDVPWATSGPVPASFISLLKSRIEQVPTEFLLNAGLTQEEITKINKIVPITWQEYSALTTKIWNAETAYNASQWNRRDTSFQGIIWPPPSSSSGGGSGGSSSIPTWLILMIGMVMVLVVIVLLLRRT